MKRFRGFRDRTTGQIYKSYQEMKKASMELYDDNDPTNFLTWHEYFEVVMS